MTEELIYHEILATPRAIKDTIEVTYPTARFIAGELYRRKIQRLFLIGNGTSYYSCLAASYTARRLGTHGAPQFYPMMAGDFRYFPPALGEDDAIIGISASGEFRDILAVFERWNAQIPCIGITQVPGSSITRLAEHTLVAGGGPSKVTVMTKTYASTLTAAHLLVLAILQAPDDILKDLQGCPAKCEQAIQAAEKAVPDILPQIDAFEHAFHFGAGCAYAASLETALKMREMAMFHAEGLETWEMASGTSMILNEQALCVALYSGGPGDLSTAEAARHARSWGARVVEIGAQAAAGDLHIPAPGLCIDAFISLCLVPPAALLAYRLAQRRGYDPERPSWGERYLVQGMSHAMGKENP
jgi:glutamine---fructose-6-phosphate transaminase (isomerizing)